MNGARGAALATSLVLVVGVTASLARAQRREGPCREDAERLCKDVKPGGGQIWKCLKEHEAQLSQSCKDRLQNARAETGKHYGACTGDIEKLCHGVQVGGGRIHACLQQHEADLSAACKAELSAGGRK